MSEHAQASQRSRGVRVVVAVALLLVGLASFGLWRVLSGSEDLAFAKGASPPSTVSVTAGRTYDLAVPGGTRAMHDHGVPVRAADRNTLVLSCRYTTPGQPGTVALPVTAGGLDSKWETTIATFVAPLTGRIHVDCSGWGAMFVPNSDDHSTDFAGWALLASIIALTIGAAVAMSEIRVAMLRRDGLRAPRDEDEIEGRVDVPVGRGQDEEVLRSDGGDVGP